MLLSGLSNQQIANYSLGQHGYLAGVSITHKTYILAVQKWNNNNNQAHLVKENAGEIKNLSASPQCNITTTSDGAQTKMPSQSAVQIKITMKGLYQKSKYKDK